MRRPSLLGVVASALALFVVQACSNTGHVTIENKAAEVVASADIEVCGQMMKAAAIEPGASRTFQFKVRGDSHFKLKVEFLSGRKLEKELGYVTNGVDSKDLIQIQSNDIVLGPP